MPNSALRRYVRLLLLPLAPLLFAQPTRPAPQQTESAAVRQASGKPDPYASESIVIEHADVVYTFAADGTGTRERTIAARVQSEAAVRALGVVGIPYAGNSEQVEIIYARVRRPDGTVVSTQPADALDMPEEVTRQAPFYSDLKQKQIPIRSLHVGDTLEWKARITRTKPEAPGQFWGAEIFTQDTVVLSETIELRVPKSAYVNVWSPTLKATETTEGDEHIYRWATSQLKPMAGKQAEADAEAKKKLVLTADEAVEADQGKLPNIAWTTFKSWQEVGLWYRSLSADRATPSAEIKAKAAELIAGKSTDEEKVRALYAYVATQFRYIGVAFGVGRYQPHTASEILENQYGDCKDKHTLLASLLAAAGFHADAVLIGAGIRFNPDVPSPASFNHLITRLELSPSPGKPAEPVWLDTTAEIAPYRMLYAVIRDKQALVIPGVAAPHIERTPAAPPFPSFQTMDAVGTLDKDGVSHSRLTFVVRGDAELVIRSAFRQVAPGQYNEMLQQISYGIGYAGKTSNAEVTRPEDTDQPFKMSYDYEREKAGDWDNLRIIPQLAPIGFPRFGDKDPLVRELNLGYPSVSTSTSSMKLPEGWGAELPEAVHAKCAYASYDLTYRFEKGVVYAERRVEILKQKVPVDGLKAYKKWADDANLGNEPYIQLTHAGSSGTKATPVPSEDASDTTKAASLIRSAYSSIEAGDLEAAKASLDQAGQLSHDQEYFWNTSGYLALKRGDPNLALADYQKELALHPSAARRMSPVIVNLQMQLGKRKEALDTLRAWAAADPSDPAAASLLMNMLLEDGDAVGAVAVGQATLPQLPDDPKKREPFRLILGGAELKAGKKEQGKATLEAILKDADDPLLLNDAAYALADASLDLPLAESSTRAALDKLGQESAGWTLDEDPQTLRAKSSLIVATWDTLGWIFFREGKLADAQSYLAASWVNGQRGDTAEHLAQVAAARGNNADAMAYYELAESKIAKYDGMGVRTPPGAKGKELERRIEALHKMGVKSTVGTAADPYKRLQSMRTFQLGFADGRNGNAEYKLLVKDGKIAKWEPTGDKEVDRADALVPKADLAMLFPPDSHLALVRFGFLNCHSGVCELLLEP